MAAPGPAFGGPRMVRLGLPLPAFPLARRTRLAQSPRTGKKVSPNESVLQHHFATSNLLKNFRVWDRCVIARLCDSPEYLSE